MARVLRAALGVVALLALGATRVGAHAVLTGSSLRDGKLPAGVAATVDLTFNAGIESGLTKVVLRGAGADRPLETRAGATASEIVVDVPALSPGAYALHYKVLAVDGHVTESVLRFEVAPP